MPKDIVLRNETSIGETWVYVTCNFLGKLSRLFARRFFFCTRNSASAFCVPVNFDGEQMPSVFVAGTTKRQRGGRLSDLVDSGLTRSLTKFVDLAD